MPPKCGVFINLTAFEPNAWQDELNWAHSLPELDHLELWLEFLPTRRQLRGMREMFAGQRLIMHGPFIGTSLAAEWDELAEASVERCSWAVEAASFLECEVVTFHAGSYPAFSTEDAALERLAARFEAFASLAEPRVTLENMPARNGATVETLGTLEGLKRMADRLPSLHFTLDVGHCLQNGESLKPFVRAYSDRIANIHLHDGLDGGRSHLALGEGELDVQDFLRCLDASGYDAFLTLETLGQEDTTVSWHALQAAKSGAPRSALAA
jgi:sugar phosphate isomerase/epimerase